MGHALLTNINTDVTEDDKPRMRNIIGGSLLSIIINGIGVKNLLPVLMDSFHTVAPEVVDSILTTSTNDTNHKYLLRSLPVNSPYYERAVRNYYNSIC